MTIDLAAMTQRVTIQRPTDIIENTGAHYHSWNNIYVAWPARIEDRGGGEGYQFGSDNVRSSGLAIVRADTDIKEQDRIMFQGRTLYVTKVKPVYDQDLHNRVSHLEVDWTENVSSLP